MDKDHIMVVIMIFGCIVTADPLTFHHPQKSRMEINEVILGVLGSLLKVSAMLDSEWSSGWILHSSASEGCIFIPRLKEPLKWDSFVSPLWCIQSLSLYIRDAAPEFRLSLRAPHSTAQVRDLHTDYQIIDLMKWCSFCHLQKYEYMSTSCSGIWVHEYILPSIHTHIHNWEWSLGYKHRLRLFIQCAGSTGGGG